MKTTPDSPMDFPFYLQYSHFFYIFTPKISGT
ncbi:hypothetical protein FIC_01259 [Flavobacteriaceae bacterium 3519-10]|nr:hypothetical protein FIC_01259 [Flavobacteriaceae bacterium 3519-10]